MAPKKVLLIGAAGQRGQQFFSKFRADKGFTISGFVLRKTISQNILDFAKEGQIYFDIDSALKSQSYDLAVITTIHKGQDELVEKLVSNGVQVLKEKPLMVDAKNSDSLSELILKNGLNSVLVSAHRPYLESFASARANLDKIGEVIGFDYTFNFALPSVTSGWRGKKDLAKGGVLLDMGYHAIDAILNIFPDIQLDDTVFDYHYPQTQGEGLEDEAHLKFSSHDGLSGSLHLNRHAENKEEIFKIFGTEFNMEVESHEARITDFNGQIVERFPTEKIDKIDPFIEALSGECDWDWKESTERAIRTNQIIFQGYQEGSWPSDDH